jgi:hypothetical protein
MSRVRMSIGVICLMVVFFGGMASGASQDTQAALKRSMTSISTWNPPYRHFVLQTGQFETTIQNDGTMGTAYGNDTICGSSGCPPFISPPGSGLNYLFMGSPWIGGIEGNDTLVTVGIDGWFSNRETAPITYGNEENVTDGQMIWTLYADTLVDLRHVQPFDHRPHKPLNIQIADRVYSKNSIGYQFETIHDMVITNIGKTAIHDGYFGYYIDGDVYSGQNTETPGYSDDITGSLKDQGIGYIIDNDGDPSPQNLYDATSPTRGIALKFLQASFAPQNPGFNWWVSSINEYYDYGPQRIDNLGQPRCNYGANLGTPTSDRYKYCMLSSGEWDFDQVFTGDTIPGWLPPTMSQQATDLADGTDARFMMSIGPFDLQPDSSVRIQFTVFTADTIHIDPANFQTNFPNHKDLFLANLGLNHFVDNANYAAQWAQTLLDPSAAPTGFRISCNSKDSTVLQWDPWVFADVIGYNLYLYEVPEAALPHPGVLPPWLTPPELNLAAEIGPTHKITLADVKPGHFYLANIANRMQGAVGTPTEPLAVQPGGRLLPPIVESTYVFVRPGEAATIRWTAPAVAGLDHYNIYRFADSTAADGKYYPFYDTGEFRSVAAPRESTFVDGQWYFYYAMTAYATVPGGTTSFTEDASDGVVYMISAVDSSGYESDYSPEITFVATPERTRDILVVTCRGKNATTTRIPCDTIVNYYQTMLQGRDFDFYIYQDTANFGATCKEDWWRDLLPYRLVILDGGLRYDIPNADSCETISGLQKYLMSGGKLAYFGSFMGLLSPNENSGPTYYTLTYPFVTDNFGVDTVYSIGIGWNFNPKSPGSPSPDTLGGFARAEHLFGNVPDAAYDTLRNPFGIFSQLFDIATAPGAAAYKVNDHGQVIQRFRSRYPASSLVEGEPVGVKTNLGATETFLFGYHLWYMKLADSRALIDYMLDDTPSATGGGGDVLPVSFELRQNFPNPFNPTTRIVFTQPKTALVRLELYNILGQKIRTLVDNQMSAGVHSVEWNGADDNGRAVASGIYFYRLKSDSFVSTRKMVLLK